MTEEELLRKYDGEIREWAQHATVGRRVTFDEAYGIIRRVFPATAARWKPGTGVGLLAFCRIRAKGAILDYRSTIRLAPKGSLAGAMRRVRDEDSETTERDPSATTSFESNEFWQKAYGALRQQHKFQLMVLYLLHREHWTNGEIAKYFDMTTGGVSQHYAKALRLLKESVSMKMWVEGRSYGKRRPPPKRPVPKFLVIPKRPECCEIGCHRPVLARGRCEAHYWRRQRRGVGGWAGMKPRRGRRKS